MWVFDEMYESINCPAISKMRKCTDEVRTKLLHHKIKSVLLPYVIKCQNQVDLASCIL